MDVNTNAKAGLSDEGRETWTIQPDADVASLMKKAMNEAVRVAERCGYKLGRRGLRTRLLNEAFRAQYEHLRGKREENMECKMTNDECGNVMRDA